MKLFLFLKSDCELKLKGRVRLKFKSFGESLLNDIYS